MQSVRQLVLSLSSVVLCLGMCPADAIGQVIEEEFTRYTPELHPSGNQFGRSMVYDDGVLAIGAFRADFADNPPEFGSVHLFDQNTGFEIGRLSAWDARLNDGFGYVVDIQDGYVAVSSVGLKNSERSVYVFDVETQQFIIKITREDGDVDGSFGQSLAIDNGVLAVGSPIGAFSNGTGPGYVYLYDIDTGELLHKVSPLDGEQGDSFGASVDIDAGRLAVGAPDSNNPVTWGGAVYVFSVNSGVQIRKFVPESLEIGAHLGTQVVSNDLRIACSAPGNINNINNEPSVYVYDAFNHTEISQLIPERISETRYYSGSLAYENDIVALGAPDFDVYAGSVFVFNATTGIQALELTPDVHSERDRFGSSVAINGFEIMSGSPGEEHDGPTSGAAYTFSAFTGSQLHRMTPAFEDSPSDSYGFDLASDGLFYAITAIGNDDRGENTGAAYVYNEFNSQLVAKLYPDSNADNAQFGYSIDIDNLTVIVGAPNEDNRGTTTGAAYVFEGHSWDRIQKFRPNDGANGDEFGSAVAVNDFFDGKVAIGASKHDRGGVNSGAVYQYNLKTGDLIRKYQAPDAAVGDRFGNAIAMDHRTIAIGAYKKSEADFQSGSAYLFNSSNGTQLFKLLPDDGAAMDFFGWSIAMNRSIVAVGAWGHDDRGTDSGAVYLFDRETGEQIAKLIPDDASAGDRFGFSLALDSGLLLIGSPRDDDNGTDSGSVYLFGAETEFELYKLRYSEGAAGDEFGRSVELDFETILAGSIGDDVYGPQSGSAQVFEIPEGICPADLNEDRALNFFDVSLFLEYLQAEDPRADMNGDSQFNFFDISLFLNAFNQGCA